MCSNELGDSTLNTLCMTMKQIGRERDEKIIAIPSILPGDVISVTKDNKKPSVSMRDKHRVTLGREKMRQTGRRRKAGDLKCIPFISSLEAVSPDAS